MPAAAVGGSHAVDEQSRGRVYPRLAFASRRDAATWCGHASPPDSAILASSWLHGKAAGGIIELVGPTTVGTVYGRSPTLSLDLLMAHDPSLPASPESLAAASRPWYRELTRYHWFVLLVAALGWMFDCLDQNLFTLARPAAMRELLPKGADGQTFEEAVPQILAAAPRTIDSGKLSDMLDYLRTRLPEVSRFEQFDALLAAMPGELRQVSTATQFEAFEEGVRSRFTALSLDQAIKDWSGYVTSIFMIGWASGGLFFGVLGDRIGRTKTMLMTVLLYSAFTGLSALSTGVWDFAFYRFLTGLGVGGEFAVGVALVAEVMPNRARPYALTTLQALSAFGNLAAGLVYLGFGIAAEHGLVESPWRKMFLVGALPALLAVAIRWRLKEPEQWQKVSHEGAVAKQLGSYRELFRNPTWRKHAFVGLALACCGVIGLWAIGFFTPQLTELVLRTRVTAQVYEEQIDAALGAGDTKSAQRAGQLRELGDLLAAPQKVPLRLLPLKDEIDKVIGGRLSQWGSYTFLMINVGAFFGMFAFGAIAQRIGRRPTFAIAFVLAFLSTAAVYWFLGSYADIFWMVPIMGFCQLSLFAGYAMYFPELFPTHLRSTGTSFCYNVGRFVAAAGPALLGPLNAFFTSKFPGGESMRYAGAAMSCVFLLGLFVLPFAPETKDKPLPE